MEDITKMCNSIKMPEKGKHCKKKLTTFLGDTVNYPNFKLTNSTDISIISKIHSCISTELRSAEKLSFTSANPSTPELYQHPRR